MALSPWPDDAVEVAAALVEIRASVETALSDTALKRLGSVSAELVERYASEAPPNCKTEAVIRTIGWLAARPADSRMSQSAVGVDTQWAPGMTGALRHSGAMSILSPFKIRRAGKI